MGSSCCHCIRVKPETNTSTEQNVVHVQTATVEIENQHQDNGNVISMGVINEGANLKDDPDSGLSPNFSTGMCNNYSNRLFLLLENVIILRKIWKAWFVHEHISKFLFDYRCHAHVWREEKLSKLVNKWL